MRSHGSLHSSTDSIFANRNQLTLLSIQGVNNGLGPLCAAVSLIFCVCVLNGHLTHGNLSNQLILKSCQIAVVHAHLIRRRNLAQALAWQSATAVTGPIAAECQGYGYSFWQGEHGALVCYGMGGQLILCYPALELLVVTTADTQGMQGANQQLYDAVHRFLLPPLQEGTAAEDNVSEADRQKLRERVARLRMEPLSHTFSRSCSPSLRDGCARTPRLSDRRRFLDPATDGCRIQGKVYRVQGDSPFTDLSLELAAESGVLCFTLGTVSCRLPFGLDEVIPCRFPVYDMFCASSGMWLDEHTFYIRTHLLDTSVGSIHFQLYFGEDDVTVFMKKQEENLFGEYSGHLYAVLAPGQRGRI